MRGHAVVPLVVAEPERDVRFHGIKAMVLKAVSADLVEKAYAPPFLPQIQEDAILHFADGREG